MTGILAGFVGATYSSIPKAPTSVSASATSSSAISVSFTAPACNGGLTIDYYQAVCTSTGTNSATASSSPVSVTGLSGGTSYTFKVRAHNSIGYGDYSSSTGTATTQAAASSSSYTSAGTYTFTAPTGVTKVSVVAVGGGGGSGFVRAGGGGALGYNNNISVTPGSNYSVVVGAGGYNTTNQTASCGGTSYFINTGYVYATGGSAGACTPPKGTGRNPPYRADHGGIGGGNGGVVGYCQPYCCPPIPNWINYSDGGAGAGGYSGQGGDSPGQPGCNGSNGSGGGGGAGGWSTYGYPYQIGGGGGGVGIYGQGSDGAGGTSLGAVGGGGSGGSSGSGANGGSYGGGTASTYTGGHICDTKYAGGGAVRIVWPGNTRTFPSTSVGSP